MSSKPNHHRGHGRIQGNGPRYENANPEAGCNSTHVARSRAEWKKRNTQKERRQWSPKEALMADERELLTLVLMDGIDVPFEDLQPSWADCCLCGSKVLAKLDGNGHVSDGDACFCGQCGAIDMWMVDDGVAYLAQHPDEVEDKIGVVRKVFWDQGGLAEWLERARGVDADAFVYWVEGIIGPFPLESAVPYLGVAVLDHHAVENTLAQRGKELIEEKGIQVRRGPYLNTTLMQGDNPIQVWTCKSVLTTDDLKKLGIERKGKKPHPTNVPRTLRFEVVEILGEVALQHITTSARKKLKSRNRRSRSSKYVEAKKARVPSTAAIAQNIPPEGS